MTVSIIIATKTLTKNLADCLKDCLNLDYSDFEIIVLPDSDFKFSHEKVKVYPTGEIGSPPKKKGFRIEIC